MKRKTLSYWHLLPAVVAIALTSQAIAQTGQNGNANTLQPFFYPAPPEGFDAAGASDADLAAYGFPQRPALTSAAYSSWLTMVRAARIRVANPTFRATNIIHRPAVTSSKVAAVGNTSYDSQNWSGIGVTASPSGYFMANGTYAVGVFQVPSIGTENCTNGPYSAAMWVAMDGYVSPGANDVLQAGVRVDACPNTIEAWFEWYTDGCASWQTACAETDVNVPAHTGDTFSISITYYTTSPHGNAFIVNNTTGLYVSVGFDQPAGLPGSTYAGTSAEWILAGCGKTRSFGETPRNRGWQEITPPWNQRLTRISEQR